jgi:hypothetical protein
MCTSRPAACAPLPPIVTSIVRLRQQQQQQQQQATSIMNSASPSIGHLFCRPCLIKCIAKAPAHHHLQHTAPLHRTSYQQGTEQQKTLDNAVYEQTAYLRGSCITLSGMRLGHHVSSSSKTWDNAITKLRTCVAAASRRLACGWAIKKTFTTLDDAIT